MMAKLILVFLTLGFLNSSYAESSKAEKLVHDDLVKTQKKLEIQSQKQETDLLKEKPMDVRNAPYYKRKDTFIMDQERNFEDRELFDGRQETSENDPVTQIERDVQFQRNVTSQGKELTDEQFVEEFKKNAEKAGLKLKIDPKTLKVSPAN